MALSGDDTPLLFDIVRRAKEIYWSDPERILLVKPGRPRMPNLIAFALLEAFDQTPDGVDEEELLDEAAGLGDFTESIRGLIEETEGIVSSPARVAFDHFIVPQLQMIMLRDDPKLLREEKRRLRRFRSRRRP